MFGDIGRSFISWLDNKDGGSIYSYSLSGIVQLEHRVHLEVMLFSFYYHHLLPVFLV